MAQRISRAKRTVGQAGVDRPRRRAHGDAGAVPRVQRGLLRRRRPRRGGDPAHPPTGVGGGRPRGRRAARADVAAPRAPRAPAPDPTAGSCRSPSRTGARGTPRSSPRASTCSSARWPATELGEYQAQAAIAALHADAPRVEDTDWVQIVEWYDELLRFADTPIVRLNRAVAVGEADGAPAGLAALARGRRRHPAARGGRGASPREERRPRTRRPPLRRRGAATRRTSPSASTRRVRRRDSTRRCASTADAALRASGPRVRCRPTRWGCRSARCTRRTPRPRSRARGRSR